MLVSDADLNHRVARLERKYRIAFITAAITSVCGVLAIAGAVGSRAGAATNTQPESKITDVLRVREINVVDGNGVTRVKIGAPLTHAVAMAIRINPGAVVPRIQSPAFCCLMQRVTSGADMRRSITDIRMSC